MSAVRPRAILIAALGGEGGGVLAEWIVSAATRAGLPVQATSVPGVAQRTGATSYYIEMLDAPAPEGLQPVFALVPTPGRVDFLISSEHLETARLLERGFASPNRTLLISSTSRVYTTAEKMQMGDGRFDPARIDALARDAARRYVRLDLERLALDHGTVVSAPMFGALSAAGAFPFGREICEATIRAGGRGTEASLRGFASAFEAVARELDAPPATIAAPVQQQPSDSLRQVVALGQGRCADYQDEAYAELYLDRVRRLTAAAGDLADPRRAHALEEAARRLALWMTYEDIPRVADLKTRPERFERIRRDAEMGDGQVLHVIEYLKPGAEEIAAMLPVGAGRWLMRRAEAGRPPWPLGRGVNIATTGVVGFWSLRLMAAGRRWRRSSLRFKEETAAIDAWLGAMERVMPVAPAFAGALAEMPRLLKGYGDTQLRGRTNYASVWERVVAPALQLPDAEAAAPDLRKALAAALADPEGKALDAALGVVLKAALPAGAA